MVTRTVKVKIKIIANVDIDEFTPDTEELPDVLEDVIEDLMHEFSGISAKDVSVTY
tara:strand:+ start:107 stop:274 length:168 start_codon:yes stop_codon:yes gene_type:complete